MTPHGPEIIHVCMPVGEVEIQDTWHVSGLCGTGRHDLSAADMFVPDQRIFALLDPAGHRPEPLYQMPPLLLFVVQLACVSLGIARGAVDELAAIAQTKVPSLRTAPLADAPVTQVELARAEGSLGGARALLYETVGEMWQNVCDGKAPSSRQLAWGGSRASRRSRPAARWRAPRTRSPAAARSTRARRCSGTPATPR